MNHVRGKFSGCENSKGLWCRGIQKLGREQVAIFWQLQIYDGGEIMDAQKFNFAP